MAEKLKPIPRFNDHGATCHGHANWMLDCEFTKPEEREVMTRVLDEWLKKYENNTIN